MFIDGEDDDQTVYTTRDMMSFVCAKFKKICPLEEFVIYVLKVNPV